MLLRRQIGLVPQELAIEAFETVRAAGEEVAGFEALVRGPAGTAAATARAICSLACSFRCRRCG